MIPYHVYLHFLIIVRKIKIIYIFTLFSLCQQEVLQGQDRTLFHLHPPSIVPLLN